MRVAAEGSAECLHHLSSSLRSITAVLCRANTTERGGEVQNRGEMGCKVYGFHPHGRSFDCVARKVPRATSLRMTDLVFL